MGAVEPDVRRAEQRELYGEPVDALCRRALVHLGLAEREVAATIGISGPMLAQLVSARRVRLGNPVATYRLTRLRELIDQVADGITDEGDVPLAVAQIKASTTPPSDPTAVARTVRPPKELTMSRLLAAKEVVRAHVRPSPLLHWPLLDRVTGAETWIKHEDANPTGAFKVRGGINFLHRLTAGEPVPGIISATRGNHGQSLAYAGAAYGVPVTIVVPEGNSPDKDAAMRALGAELIVHGSDFQEAREYAGELAEERDLLPVPPFHPWLVEGVATYASEIHASLPDVETIYVPVGMGSGICANILVRDLLGKDTEIVGVVSSGAPAYALSYQRGEPVPTESVDTIVDGVAVRTPDPDAVRIIARGAARFVQVSDEEVQRAMALAYRATHHLCEPSGVVALAGLIADATGRAAAGGRRRTVACVQSGGNCDFPILAEAMRRFG